MNYKNLLENLKLLPVYIIFLPLWTMAGLGKLFGGAVPEHFHEMFSKTFIGQFPGTTFAFYMIAIVETLAAALFFMSLLNREFMQKKQKPILNWAMFISFFCFSILGFGLRVAGNNDMATQLFTYCAGTAVIWMLVERK